MSSASPVALGWCLNDGDALPRSSHPGDTRVSRHQGVRRRPRLRGHDRALARRQGVAQALARADPELREHLLRCHSTVRGLMKSSAPISGFVRPGDGEPRDVLLLRREVVAGVVACACGPSRRSRAARGARARRTRRAPIASNSSCAVRSCSRASDPAALAAQPLAVEQVPARELHAQARAAEARDRLAVRALGGVALGSAGRGPGPRSPAPSRCGSPACAPTPIRARPRASARSPVLDAASASSPTTNCAVPDVVAVLERRPRGVATPRRSGRCRCRAPPSRRWRCRPSGRGRARSPPASCARSARTASASWPRHAASIIST